MAIFSTIAAGTAAAKSAGVSVDDVLNTFGLGGSKEEGYGTAKPGTLAHAIDKYEGVSDAQAVRIAPEAARVYIETGSKRQAAAYIARQIGGDPDGLYNSHKFAYVSEELDKARRSYQSEMSAPTAAATSTGGGFSQIVNRSSIVVIILIGISAFFIVRSS